MKEKKSIARIGIKNERKCKRKYYSFNSIKISEKTLKFDNIEFHKKNFMLLRKQLI